MTEPAKQARREYYREWRRKNPDKVRATMQRYWMKKAAAQQEQQNQEQPAAAEPVKRGRRIIE